MKAFAFPLIVVFFSVSLFCSSSSTSITLSLSRVAQNSPTTKWQELNRLAAASTSRVHNLKQLKSDVKLPVFPRGFGEYTMSLSFGTPPQKLSFVMDTGSSIVWMPCTKQYSCTSCEKPGVQPKDLNIFEPKSSSSSTNVSCDSPKFIRIFPIYKHARNCIHGKTMYYNSYFKTGHTTGYWLFESLTFPEIGQRYEDFLMGCSLFTEGVPLGVAGLGRYHNSLPVQMGLSSFSYCLLSHKYDNNSVTSNLILTQGKEASDPGLSYTPFGHNFDIFGGYYYLFLQNIKVGGVDVKGLESALKPDTYLGNGGTILDSGSAFTYLETSMFNSLAKEFEQQLAGKKFNRNTAAEKKTGLGLCFDVPRGGSSLQSVPKLSFHFEGNTVMDLPLENYFLIDGSVGCLLMINGLPSSDGTGPAVILGNYLQQNYFMEYDLKNDKLGILPKDCGK